MKPRTPTVEELKMQLAEVRMQIWESEIDALTNVTNTLEAAKGLDNLVSVLQENIATLQDDRRVATQNIINALTTTREFLVREQHAIRTQLDERADRLKAERDGETSAG